MKLKDLAAQIEARIGSGDANAEIENAAGMDIADARHITFLANPKYTPQLKTTRAGAVLVGENVAVERADIAVLHVEDPYLAYTKALRLFNPEKSAEAFRHESAVVDETAKIGADVYIGANAVIGKNCEIGEGARILANVTLYDNVKIGARSVLHSGVSVRENCEIGDDCILHNNVVIGSDGFGYAKNADKSWLKIPQIGRVVLENDVEIGANSAVDCASVGETRLKRGAKIDNLVQIGHSCTIDEDALICAQTGLAGSSFIGKRVILAGQVGIAGHLKVGDDAILTAKSATSHDVENGKTLSGIPAFDNREWLRSTAAYRRLGDMSKTLRDLEKRLAQLEKQAE